VARGAELYRARSEARLTVSAPLLERFERSVSLLCWGYNEEASIEAFFDRALALMEATVTDFEIVFVDDGSTDRTAELALARAAADPRIRVVRNERNLNVGSSAYAAIHAATKEITFWQTIDWAYDLRHLRIFLELTRHFDVVQGIRPTPIRLFSYVPVIRSIYRVKTRSDTLRKAIVSLINYYSLRVLFGCRFQDFQNVTFYRRRDILDIDIRGTTAFSNPRLLIGTYDKGLTYIEVPISFLRRVKGKAKGTRLRSIGRSVSDMWAAWIQWGWRFRLRQRGETRRRIFRVLEPFDLDDEVLALVLPLFKEYR
jgi:glycosyltransferase involved in cell wall biosynthesis